MKQKTRIASKLFAALVVLTLISCCFLGTTMARYTTGESGAATVDVALWDVDFNETNSGTISFGPISPNMTGYNDDNKQDQTNPIAASTMVVITNNSEVSAKVTVVISDITYTAVSGGSVSFGTGDGMTYSNGEVSGTPTQQQVEAALRFAVTVTGATQDNTYTSADGSVAYVGTLNDQSSATESISVSASLTWVTAYSTTQSGGVLEDAIDTWIGENIASLSISVSYTAVQASVLP